METWNGSSGESRGKREKGGEGFLRGKKWSLLDIYQDILKKRV